MKIKLELDDKQLFLLLDIAHKMIDSVNEFVDRCEDVEVGQMLKDHDHRIKTIEDKLNIE